MIELKLLKYQRLINKELKNFIGRHLVNIPSEWNKQFNKELSSYLIAGGKRLRPVLATIIYEGIGGKNLSSFAKLSLSAEILHNSTLIHDDLIDTSDIRRNKSSFHKRFEVLFNKKMINNAKKESESMAILAGDYLIFLALQCILDSDFSDEKKLYVIKVIRETSETVIRGQILDDEMEYSNATEADYMKLIEMKTASVFEYSTKVATVLADAKDGISHVLWNYSKAVGCAFQIQDDILGIFGKQNELGKPLTSDLAEGKKTILILKAYENANGMQKNILDRIIGNKNVNLDNVEEIKKVLRETKALDYAKGLANNYANESINLLKPLKGKISDDAYNILYKLPTLIISRNY